MDPDMEEIWDGGIEEMGEIEMPEWDDDEEEESKDDSEDKDDDPPILMGVPMPPGDNEWDDDIW